MKTYLQLLVIQSVILTVLQTSNVQSQLVINTGQTPNQLVQNVLLGGGVQINSVTFTGSTVAPYIQIGEFTNGNTTNLGLTNGIVIATGHVTNIPGTSSGLMADMMTTSLSDPDCDILGGNNGSYDAAVLEFDFMPLGDTVMFRYVFASEEYSDYVNSGFNDVFGFFISGPGITGPYSNNSANIALIPGTTTPVAINNVNNGYSSGCSTGPCTNCSFYVENCNGTTIVFDGFTTVLTAMAVVQACQWYHLKLAVSDIGDPILDAAVFLEANSFNVSGAFVSSGYDNAVVPDNAVEGCNDGYIAFVTTSPVTSPLTITWTIGGTATNGVDYTMIPNSIVIPTGSDSVGIWIHPIADGITEGTETVTLTINGIGCGGSQVVTINIYDNTPLVAVCSNDQTICDGTQPAVISVNGSGGMSPYTYAWDNGAGAGTSASVSPPMGTTIYTVTINDVCGATATDQVSVEVIDCSSPCIINNMTTTISPCTPTPGQYSVSGTVIFIDPPSAGTLTITNSCGGTPVILNAPFTSPATYSFTNLTENGISCSITATFSADPACTYSSAYTAPVEVSVIPGVPITLTCTAPTGTISAAGSPAGVTYQWSGPGIVSGGNTYAPTVNTAGTYIVTVTHPNGCSVTASINVNSNTTPPAANAGVSPTLTCTLTSTILNGSSTTPGATASWSGPGIISGGYTFTPTINAPGTYTITVTDPANGCTSTTSVNVNINTTPPDANAGVQATLTCVAPTATLNGSSTTPGATASWSGPGIMSGGSTFTPTVNAPGTYTLTVTDPANGCTSTASVTILSTVTPPDLSTALPFMLTCSVTSGTITASSTTPGVTFNWNGPGIVSGGNTASPIVNMAGNYTVTITDPANGCTNTDTIIVPINITPPGAGAGTSPTLTCSTTSVTLNGSSTTTGATASWTGPGILSGGNTFTPTVNAPGSYTITVTDPANGCTSTASVNVPINTTPPAANAGVSPTLTCTLTSTILNGSSTTPGATASWSGPGIISGGYTFTPTINAPGTYTITVTDPANGCTSTSTVNVMTDTIHPDLTMGQPLQLACVPSTGNVSAVSATPGVIYYWTGPGILSGNNSTSPLVNSSGTYNVVVTNPSNGCTSTGSVIVIAAPLPTASISESTDITCHGGDDGMAGVAVTGGTVPYSYLWNDPPPAQITETAEGLTAGTWTVTVTDDNGCTATTSVLITEPSPVFIHPPGNKYICNGQTAVLTANASGGTGPWNFFWDDIAGSSTYTVSPEFQTTYMVYAYDANGCPSDTGYVTVSVTPAVEMQLFANEPYICPGDPVVISAYFYNGIPPYHLYDEYGNIVTPPLLLNLYEDSLITLTVEDQCGSSATDQVLVQMWPLPPVYFAADQYQGCTPFTIHFNENSPENGQSYVWNFGDNDLNNLSFSKNPVHIYDEPGVYDVTLTVTSEEGCVNQMTISQMIHVFTGPIAKFSADPNAATIIKPLIFFENQSINADSYTWVFGDGDTSIIVNPWHTFPTIPTGTYNVMLIAHTDKGCADTTWKEIEINDVVTFYAPSAFTPDYDGINDFFVVKGNGINPHNFKLLIYDRWGEMVFESNDLLQGWDGRIKNGGIGKNGCYTWLCIF
ncbi:MAG: choice-of-anchor L domain-containing protein, partial [Bacteroidota bacterium]